jgi:hypothetical protein
MKDISHWFSLLFVIAVSWNENFLQAQTPVPCFGLYEEELQAAKEYANGYTGGDAEADITRPDGTDGWHAHGFA